MIVGPVLHITCSPEIQFFDPATITLPFSLQNNNECAKLSSGNVRVLVNSHEEDENEKPVFEDDLDDIGECFVRTVCIMHNTLSKLFLFVMMVWL